MSRVSLPHSALTVGSLVESGRGINLHCACGHRTALLPVQISTLAHPATRLLDFKRRFRCSMCGASGASEDIRLKIFEVAASFMEGGAGVPEVVPAKRVEN